MQMMKNLLCFAITLLFLGLSIFSTQEAPNSDVQSDYDLEYQYVIGLQGAREICYERILFLGAVSKEDISLVKQELEDYLQEIQALQQKIEDDGLLRHTVRLDERFVSNTLQAIKAEDAQYLKNLGEMYRQLQEYQDKLFVNYLVK